MNKKTLNIIVVSNIVELVKQNRSNEIENYFRTINEIEGMTKDEFNICCGLAIKNLERLGHFNK